MIQLALEIRCAIHFLACEVPGDMTQKGELVLTAPPGGGGTARVRTQGLLHCPPAVGTLQEPPRMAPETKRRAPKLA